MATLQFVLEQQGEELDWAELLFPGQLGALLQALQHP
jgi:hypothetical protein